MADRRDTTDGEDQQPKLGQQLHGEALTEDDFYGEKLIARVGLGKEPHRRGWHIMVRYGQKSKRSPVFGSPETMLRAEAQQRCNAWYREWRAAQDKLVPESEKGRMTLDALWRFHFLKDIDRILPNKQTQKNYHSRLKRILPVLGKIRLRDFDGSRALEDFLWSMSAEHNKNPELESWQTVKHYKDTLSKLFRYAIRRRFLVHNPIKDVPMPPKDSGDYYKPRPVYEFTPKDHETGLILHALPRGSSGTPGHFVRPYMEMVAAQVGGPGLSKSESRRLKWRFWNNTDEVIQIHGVDVPPGAIYIHRSKTSARERVWQLDESLNTILRAWYAVTPYKQPNDYVFCDEAGDQLPDRSIWTALREAGELVGLPHVASHCFRRYWKTKQNRLGMPMTDQLAGGGWANPKTAGKYTEADHERRLQYSRATCRAVGLDKLADEIKGQAKAAVAGISGGPHGVTQRYPTKISEEC